jgi:hypothetical protein
LLPVRWRRLSARATSCSWTWDLFHLDILGLEVDLSRVILDTDAQAGAGNLLGNLLCAVVHLLDGPAIRAAVQNILDQINAILGVI